MYIYIYISIYIFSSVLSPRNVSVATRLSMDRVVDTIVRGACIMEGVVALTDR